MSDQDNGTQQTDDDMKFDRGTGLSIFTVDRNEDFIALTIALIIALGVYVTVA